MYASQPLQSIRVFALCSVVGFVAASDNTAIAQRPERSDSDQREPAALEVSVQETVADDKGLSPGEALELRRHAQAIAWLADQYATAAELHQFAGERVKNEAVSRYAKHSAMLAEQAAGKLEQVANRLNQTVPPVETGAEDGQDLSETVGEIGQAVQQRLEARAVKREPSQPPTLRNRVATEDEQQEARRRDGRLLDRVGDAPEGTARDRLRVVLPALRKNLPAILALVAEAIEDDGAGENAQWLKQQQQITDHVLKAKQDELAQYEGRELEQAYLGLALVSNLELRAATQTLADGTNTELQDVVSDMPKQLLQSMTEARQLMER